MAQASPPDPPPAVITRHSSRGELAVQANKEPPPVVNTRHSSRGELAPQASTYGTGAAAAASAAAAAALAEAEKVRRPLAGAAYRSVQTAAARHGLGPAQPPSAHPSSSSAMTMHTAPAAPPGRAASAPHASDHKPVAAHPIPWLNKFGARAQPDPAHAGSSSGAAGTHMKHRENPDEHPFEVGHCLIVSYRDNSPRIAKIIAVNGNKTDNKWRYYLHYFDFNRRMDEWITCDRIIKLPSEANPLGQERMDAEASLHKAKSPAVIAIMGASVEEAVRKKRGRPSKTNNQFSMLDGGDDSGTELLQAARGLGNRGALFLYILLHRNYSVCNHPTPLTLPNYNSAINSVHRAKAALAQSRGEDSESQNESRLVKGRYHPSADDMDTDEHMDHDDGEGRHGRDRDNDDVHSGDEEDDDDDENDEEDESDDNQKGSSSGGAMGHLKSHAPSTSSSHSVSYSSSNLSSHRKAARSVVKEDDNADPNRPTTIKELEHDEHEGLDAAQLLEHEEWTKIKNVNTVLFGRSIMECWYFSPFPKEYHPDGPVDCLYFCEFTLRFFRTKEELRLYQSKPNLPRHPPGNEIYRDSKVSMFELDGAVEKIYCQNLCYFAKLFLDHKTLVYDVDPFLFYVLCTQDDKGFHPVGYFSKEKYSDMGYNLACILTFPSSQRQGFGRFLIAFSYELSKKENKLGSPEKPLSDLGNLSYRSYWAGIILNVLRSYQGQILSILDLAKMTSFISADIIQTLDMLGLLQYVDDVPMICAPKENLDDLMAKFPQNGLQVDPEKLHWAPLYVTDAKKDKWKFLSNS